MSAKDIFHDSVKNALTHDRINHRENAMRLEAIVNEEGILTVKFPKSLWGKKVWVSVQVVPDKPAHGTHSVLDIFAEADKLEFPRRTHAEILEELQVLRGKE